MKNQDPKNIGNIMGFESKQNNPPKKQEQTNFYKQYNQRILKEMAQDVFGISKNEKENK